MWIYYINIFYCNFVLNYNSSHRVGKPLKRFLDWCGTPSLSPESHNNELLNKATPLKHSMDTIEFLVSLHRPNPRPLVDLCMHLLLQIAEAP